MTHYGIIIRVIRDDKSSELETMILTFDNQDIREKYIKDKFDVLSKCHPSLVTIILPTLTSQGKIECECIGDKCKLKGIDIKDIKLKHIKV